MRMYTAARWHKQATELEQELHFRGQSAGVLPSNCQARYLQVVRGKDRYFSPTEVRQKGTGCQRKA